jgi:opacity protein-like surface antigen
MKLRRVVLGLVLGSVLIAAAGTATAADSGFYATADAGIASFPKPKPETGIIAPTFKVQDQENRDFAWSFALGYHFNANIAVEAGFTNLGRNVTRLVAPAQPAPNVYEGRISFGAKGKTLALLTHAPIGNWDPFLKLGLMYSVADLTLHGKIADSGLSLDDRREEVHGFVGVGVRYAFSEEWVLSAGVDYYRQLHDEDRIGTVSVLSPRIGFAHRF